MTQTRVKEDSYLCSVSFEALSGLTPFRNLKPPLGFGGLLT